MKKYFYFLLIVLFWGCKSEELVRSADSIAGEYLIKDFYTEIGGNPAAYIFSDTSKAQIRSLTFKKINETRIDIAINVVDANNRKYKKDFTGIELLTDQDANNWSYRFLQNTATNQTLPAGIIYKETSGDVLGNLRLIETSTRTVIIQFKKP